MNRTARRACFGAALIMAAPVAAQSRATLRVEDLSPRFLAFYDAAVGEPNADRRFALWKEHYGFAALPPVPQADSMARAMLDEAWPRYPEVMDRIRAGAPGMQPAAEPTLRAVAGLLGADTITVRLLAYVGAREGNAFTNVSQGVITVAMPIEEDSAWRELVMVHEMTHAVHHRLAGYSEGWERTIGRTLFAEGLAARVTEALIPGRPSTAYLEHRPGWMAAAQAHDAQILRGILPHLGTSDGQTVLRFTMGTGTTGTEREAYYAGWRVIGHLLRRGYTFPQLARIPESEAPALVETAIREILAGTLDP